MHVASMLRSALVTNLSKCHKVRLLLTLLRWFAMVQFSVNIFVDIPHVVQNHK